MQDTLQSLPEHVTDKRPSVVIARASKPDGGVDRQIIPNAVTEREDEVEEFVLFLPVGQFWNQKVLWGSLGK